ncbi:MAG: hypothetical protein ABFS37_10150, partial [Acidobacteriota bacterium]
MTMSNFDGSWREFQFETLVDLSLSVGGVRPEDELVEGLLQHAVGTLDAGCGLAGTLRRDRQFSFVRAMGIRADLEHLELLFGLDLLERLGRGEVIRL